MITNHKDVIDVSNDEPVVLVKLPFFNSRAAFFNYIQDVPFTGRFFSFSKPHACQEGPTDSLVLNGSLCLGLT